MLNIIEEKPLDPHLFQVEESDTGDLFLVQLLDSPHEFQVIQSPDDFHRFSWKYTEYKPNFPMTERWPYKGWETADKLYKAFKFWLDLPVSIYLLEQVEPDLWERISSQEPLLTGSALILEDTEYFTDSEKIRLRMSVETLRLSVVNTFQPSDDQLKVIDGHLEYLKHAVDRLCRIDWRAIAVMTSIQIATVLTLDTEKGRVLLSLFEQAFSEALKLIH